MTTKIPVNVTYSVTKMVNTSVEIDLADYQEWLEGDKVSDDNTREYLSALDMYALGQLLGEYDWSSVEDIYIEKVAGTNDL